MLDTQSYNSEYMNFIYLSSAMMLKFTLWSVGILHPSNTVFQSVQWNLDILVCVSDNLLLIFQW